ncbi:hypothetical protein BKK49_10085 [Rodentibacter rarus]|uniref:Uncharacterized protein n=1 Tax=Rodentibacter rarus TaxID=1908260 RepID=A0A1V3IQR7_9PAST|nr:hypothetical protein [Rodentibacter rarus]OOF38234.1 hypothetical protein BKK49_10085 [Rodentibacter rarus]OOF44612.1 hypothetical protein BKK50_02070 [Rodentibacter rarus]
MHDFHFSRHTSHMALIYLSHFVVLHSPKRAGIARLVQGENLFVQLLHNVEKLVKNRPHFL